MGSHYRFFCRAPEQQADPVFSNRLYLAIATVRPNSNNSMLHGTFNHSRLKTIPSDIILHSAICNSPNTDVSIYPECRMCFSKLNIFRISNCFRPVWRYEVQECFLGRLPNFGSRPNTMGGKFPSVCPSIHKKFLRFR